MHTCIVIMDVVQLAYLVQRCAVHLVSMACVKMGNVSASENGKENAAIFVRWIIMHAQYNYNIIIT